ncbi:MAG: Ig-like domain-containing protein [Bacteroidota bacterium]|nr:Ig-like domain-containing protein [Bacteroidota bacterium]
MKNYFLLFFILWSISCSKKTEPTAPPPPPGIFNLVAIKVNDQQAAKGNNFFNVNINSAIKISFTAPVDHASGANNISLLKNSGAPATFNISYVNNDSAILIQPSPSLQSLSKYVLTIAKGLQSKQGVALSANTTDNLITEIDSTDKFPRVSDSALLDIIQKQTFKYFWDFGHPVSGMARERNTSGDVVTTGGTGFGVMSILIAINRNFISRTDGLQRINTIVNFLKNNCTRYHGAFSHWINGASGATIPFSAQDDGGDLVETSFLMQGLLCARQFFKTTDANETALRSNINILWNGIEWNWFRNGAQNVLYWHWSPNYNFALNVPIKGWNEAMVVYALAASSNTDSIPRIVYDNGWASNGGMKNGATYYGVQLPLGPDLGGPLFFSDYSFLGINPHDLTDAYANYFTQNTAHSLINYNYCVANPQHFNGYSSAIWGLTASDDNLTSYSAHSPTNDDGVISPTAAISSLPYTPQQSLNALRFFYYTLGDKLFQQYGFIDAFNLSDYWFADSFLAIDQGPQIVMIEDYRSGLIWNLFMSCPEIKRGMKNSGFQSPNL